MSVMMVPMRRLALGHQIHLALGAATRVLLPHVWMHRADIENVGMHGLRLRVMGCMQSISCRWSPIQGSRAPSAVLM